MRSEVGVRPAVEATVLYARHVVGTRSSPSIVALVDRRPELVAPRPQREADGIADARGKHAASAAIRVHLQDRRARLALDVHVGQRADSDIELGVVGVEASARVQ